MLNRKILNKISDLFIMFGFRRFKAKGWKRYRKFICGKYNNYNFTVFQGEECKHIFVPLKGISQQEIKVIQNYLDNNAKKFNLKNYFFEEEILQMIISEKMWYLSGRKLENILSDFTMFLNLSNIHLQNRCMFCGENGANKAILKTNILCEVHEACYTEEINRVITERDAFELEGKNYIRGTIGAIFGGIAAFIINIMIILFFEDLVIVSGVIFAEGTFLGYKFLNGKMGKNTKYIVILSTIFSIFSAEIIFIILYIIGMDMPLNMSNFMLTLKNSDVRKFVIFSLPWLLGTSALSIYRIIKEVNYKIKNQLPMIKKISL